jgi:hypothetical protein
MASTAQKAPIRSYAKAASKKAEKKTSIFAETVCKLSIPKGYPTRKIPSTEEKCVLFVDLNGHNEEEVAEAIKGLDIMGTVYRSDLNTLELVFSTEQERMKALATTTTAKNGREVTLIRPRSECPKLVYVRVANMPFGDEETLKETLKKHWQQYGLIVDIGVHKQKATGWRTRRWDLLVGLKEGEDLLEAPVAFEIDSRKVVAAWPGSPPSCLACHSAGHQAKKCLQKNPKVGGRPDPEKKDRQEKSKKGKDTEMVLEVLPKPKQAKIGEKTVSATVSESASKSVEDLQSDLQEAIPTQENAGNGENNEQMEVERPETPPSQLINKVLDKGTPRSQSGKRMSKGIGVPIDYINPAFNKGERAAMLEEDEYCGNCGGQHSNEECTEAYPYSGEKARANFKGSLDATDLWMKRIRREKAKRKAATKRGSGGSSSAVFENIPPWCTKCREEGHKSGSCLQANCEKCGSESHLTQFCAWGK